MLQSIVSIMISYINTISFYVYQVSSMIGRGKKAEVKLM